MRFLLATLLLACSTHKSVEPAPAESIKPLPRCAASKLTPFAIHGSSSPIALGRLGSARVAALADEDDATLRLLDVDAHKELMHASLPAAPGHVLIDRHGRIQVTIPALDTVMSFNDSLEECGREKTGEQPRALAEAGDVMLVAGRSSLTFLPAHKTIALSRDAEGIVIEGGNAIVSHSTGSIVSVVALDQKIVAREISFAWRDRVAIGSVIIADMPRFAVQAHGLAVLGDRVQVPLTIAYPGDTHLDVSITIGYGASTVRGIDGYFPHEQAIASLHATKPELRFDRETIGDRVQRVSHGRRAPAQPACLLPRAVAARGPELVVTCIGIDRLMVYGDGDLSHAERARIPVPAGPVGLALDGEDAIVWSQFARSLSVVSLKHHSIDSFAIAPEHVQPVAWIEGRKTFHAPLGFDGRACASCHPGGHDDGLVWTSPHGPMQPPVLAGRLAATAPYGWLGMANDLPAHLTETMKRIGAKPMDKQTMDSLATYVMSLEAPPKKELDPLAKRGRDLFKSPEVACASCHQDGGTDGMKHDVGTGGMIDTPSLAGIGASGPYMHDGRFATLREAIALESMATTKNLSDADLTALVAYLRTL